MGMMQENAFLKSLSGKTLGVYFNAYRSKAYDGGGEENLTFNGTYCNVGGGLDTDTGIFTCPTGGTYIIMDVKRGDEIVVYAYTGTWLADFPMNHYTHWVGLLLKPSQEEAEQLKKEAYESC